MFFKKKTSIDKLFLTAKNPYSKKRTLKLHNILIGAVVVLIAFMVVVTIFEKKQNIKEGKSFNEVSSLKIKVFSAESSSFSTAKLSDKALYDDLEVPSPTRLAKKKAPDSQLIEFDNQGQKSLLGVKVLVELLGNVKLAEGMSLPVEVGVLSVLSEREGLFNSSFIEEGGRLFGAGKLNPKSEKLEVIFHTFVDSFGKHRTIKAHAFMPDGSFGIRGKYSSGEFKKYSSSVVGNFIGGVSQGLRRKSVTKSGVVLEIGSLKNALLKGLSTSALDYARKKVHKQGGPQASISILDKTRFFVRLR